MNRLIFMLFVTSVGIMLAPPLAHAQFRRGCSTGHCFTPHVQHVAPVIEQRDILQNFFIGLAPAPLLDSPRGTTVYGRDFASEVVLASDKDYLNLGTLLANGGIDAMATARSIRPGLELIASKNAEANLALARGEAVATAFRAVGGDTSGTARTVVMTLRNGKLEQFQELHATPAEIPAESPPVPRAVITELSCLKCHAPGASAAAKFVIDDTFDFRRYLQAKDAVESGRMPPKVALPEDEKAKVVWQLGKLVP